MMQIRNLLGFLVGIMIVVGCGETPGATVEFKVITQSNDLIAFDAHTGFYPQESPAIMIGTFTAEKESLIPYIYKESQADYRSAISTDTVLMTVFMGVDQIPGAAIMVDTITATDGDLYIQVDIDEGKQRLVPAAGTRSPFQVVSIPTRSFPEGRPVTVHLIDDATNEEIATTVYPAP